MEFDTTAEQEELRRTVRRLLTERCGSAHVRAALEQPDRQDPQLHALMAEQLGLHGLAVPEAHGGAGYGLVEQAIVFEELGRACAPGSFFATVGLAGSLLLATPHEPARERLLPDLAAGAVRLTWAWAEPGTPDAPVGTAEQAGSTWRVTGRARRVLDGAVADVLLVHGESADGPVLLSVPRDQEGVVTTPLRTLDLTRTAADVVLADAVAELVAPAEVAGGVLRRGLATARVLLCAEQVGGTQRCLDETVAYAKVRHQFGRAIGSFQAVKHRLADMLVRAELARSAAYYAAWTATEDGPDVLWTATASAFCSEAFLACATDSIQAHGGIGFTWEHDAHLLYRRARSDHGLLGTPTQHRALLATHLGSAA